MNRHHAHSHRARRPTHRSRPDIAKPHEWMERVERRRARLAAGPVEVVVTLPGPLRVTAGQQAGVPLRPGIGYVQRWITESADRRRREREEAARQAEGITDVHA